MTLLRDVSLRTKLYTLMAGYTLIVIAVLVFAGYLLDRHRVGGQVYQELSDQKDLVNELTPPPLLIGRVFLMLQEIETATTDAERQRIENQYRLYADDYRNTHRKWLGKTLDPTVRRALETTIHQPALNVFSLAETEYFPKARDEKTRKEATAVLREKITPQYREHTKAVYETIDVVKKQAD